MAILSTEIDPNIAQALAVREHSLLADAPSAVSSPVVEVHTGDIPTPPVPGLRTPEERRAEAVLLKQGAKKGSSVKEKVGVTLSGVVLCGLAWFLMPTVPVAAWALIVLGLVLLLGGIFSEMRRPRKGSILREGVISYTSDVLHALLPLLSLTPLEKRYGDILTALAREPAPLDSVSAANLLEQVNGLLADSRALESRRLELTETIAATDTAALERERLRFLSESNAADDPIVRDTKKQSAQLLADRLEDARVVSRMVERMRAQEEAIYETMATLHSSLLRIGLTPTEVRAVDISGLRDSVDRARRQTQAVEAAVQELGGVRL